jgi:hypothetical protein
MTQYHGSTKHFILEHSRYALAGDFESREKNLSGYMVFSAHLVSHVLECHLPCFEVYAKLAH